MSLLGEPSKNKGTLNTPKEARTHMVSGNSITELLKQRVFDSNLTRLVPALLSLSFCLLTCRTVFILGKRHNNFFKVALSIIRLASRFRRVRRHFTTEPDGFTNSCMERCGSRLQGYVEPGSRRLMSPSSFGTSTRPSSTCQRIGNRMRPGGQRCSNG